MLLNMMGCVQPGNKLSEYRLKLFSDTSIHVKDLCGHVLSGEESKEKGGGWAMRRKKLPHEVGPIPIRTAPDAAKTHRTFTVSIFFVQASWP